MDNIFDPPTTGDPTSSSAADAPRPASSVPTPPSMPVNGGVAASSPVATSAPVSSPAAVRSPSLTTQPPLPASGQNPAPSMQPPNPAHGQAPSPLSSPPRPTADQSQSPSITPASIPPEQGQLASMPPQQPSPVTAVPSIDRSHPNHDNRRDPTTGNTGPKTWSDIVIHPDMPMDEIDEVARGLGRPKANAEAEALIKKWFRVIDRLASGPPTLSKILKFLSTKSDGAAFKKEFGDDVKKFGRFIRAARASAK